jgi:hypothetical protein
MSWLRIPMRWRPWICCCYSSLISVFRLRALLSQLFGNDLAFLSAILTMIVDGSWFGVDMKDFASKPFCESAIKNDYYL